MVDAVCNEAVGIHFYEVLGHRIIVDGVTETPHAGLVYRFNPVWRPQRVLTNDSAAMKFLGVF